MSSFSKHVNSKLQKIRKAYNKNKGTRIKLTENEMIGNGLGVAKALKKVAKVARKIGQVAMKSGIGDLLIDEAVGVLPIPIIAKKAVSEVVKKQARDLTGTDVGDSDTNPYIPHSLQGGGLQKYGVPLTTQSNSSNIVPVTSDAYHHQFIIYNHILIL